MSITEYLGLALQGGYASTGIDIKVMLVCMALTLALSLYIWLVYSVVNKRSFYDPSFDLSLIVISLITAAIILTIQSNIVVSLGMVGSLSIIRFRTAVKSPMDLVFLFWSISTGIICGAGYTLIAIISSLTVSIVIILFSMRSAKTGNLLLVVNMKEYDEKVLLPVVEANTILMNVRARNVTPNGTNFAIEVKTADAEALVNAVKSMEDVTNVSLLEHNGDITGQYEIS